MSDLVSNLTEFCHLLRHSGMNIGPGDSLDALRALSLLDIRERGQVYLGLRTVLARRRSDYPTFDAAFRLFFDGETPEETEEIRRRPDEGQEGIEEDADAGGEGGYTAEERLMEQDIAEMDSYGQAEAAAAALRIARRLALRLSRRRRVARRAARLSLRDTVRRSARYAGLPLELVRRARRRKPATLVLLLDVSGSMEPYSRTLLQFVHALQSSLPRTHSFCFATSLAPVTSELSEELYAAALGRARRKVDGWGGGTRIGASLAEFAAEWGSSLLTTRTAVILLSDGLDTGEPELVGQAMAQIRSRAGRLIWLNPLAGDPRYQPLARGMAAALPHLDILAPGHNLASLTALEHQLGRLPT